ncbi:ParB/RepB/Spo0J family partition protein [Acetilactobacillus jinshanensis]|uniref:ParB/RepB/Spo0J family partition protein n=1 Tax=Acetilactobacillus jinshanensis TaxID=1720083 RepID=A0A4P6ZJC8_9LACO|nr:ParB/RepB/Spo0J family partition protein [Acetilactobacillus jinshanensis]QBP17714.1 ParB/RepB/Spo0J family partition protein [Acetilactobacillus jinshanensis]URL61742.1 ParB/RepB/Spo0J family partition protein [uncultured bacterium]
MASNKKGLGRGIAALFGDSSLNTGETVVHIPLSKLVPNPYQPRVRFDRKSLNGLAQSIKEDGVFQPIIVRKSLHHAGQYEILAGERRFRASKIAKKQTIPAIVRNATNEQMMEIAVMENLQREDLTPLEEAKAYNTLMIKLHLTQSQVSKRLGKSRPYIANYLRLLGLPTEVKAMLQNKQLSMGQARALLAVQNKQQLVALAKRAYQKTLTVRQINQLIAKMQPQQKRRRRRYSPRKSPFVRETENQLQDKFGTKVSLHSPRGSHGKGQIKIDYTSQNDLNRILKILNINLD